MSMRKPKVLVHPTVEPVTLAEARLHLRLDAYDSPAAHPDDAIVEGLITAARQWAEEFCERTIAQATLELALDEWPETPAPSQPLPVYLPRAPLQELQSVVYIDGAGVQQDLTSYQLDNYDEPPRLMPAAGASWPATQDKRLNAVRIRYRAGHTLPGDSPDLHPLPKPIKQAILLILGHLYEHREDSTPVRLDQIPLGAQTLLRKYRLANGFA